MVVQTEGAITKPGYVVGSQPPGQSGRCWGNWGHLPPPPTTAPHGRVLPPACGRTCCSRSNASVAALIQRTHCPRLVRSVVTSGAGQMYEKRKRSLLVQLLSRAMPYPHHARTAPMSTATESTVTPDDEHDSVTEEPERPLATGEKQAIARTGAAPIDTALTSRPFGHPQRYESKLRHDTLSRPPLAYQSANIRKLDGYEDHATSLAGSVAAFDAMHAAVVSIIDAREKSTRDPTLGSEAAQVLKVATYADKLMEAASRKMDSAYQALQGQIKATEEELSRAVAVGIHTTLATEIRAHAKSEKSPTQFVGNLIAQGDAQSVSAILGAPAFLSGLTEDMRAALVKQWNSKRNPVLTKRLALLQAVSDKLERAGSSLLPTVERAMGVKYETVKRLRDAQAAASFG